MKTEKNILIAFILNLSFCIFEFAGGAFTGSVAIMSDAVHDAGDAASIGISYLFERKSKAQANEKYTYGYARYSAMGGFIMTVILLIGSAIMIYNAVKRIITPASIDHNGMILFAVIGVCVNFCAALFTRRGDSLNEKAVNLHMLEDVLSWLVILIGAVLMRFTNLDVIDPVMSIGVSLFLIVNAIKNLKAISELFLEKTPCGTDITEIKKRIENICGVIDVHHIHVWSIDGQNGIATLHIVADGDMCKIKDEIRRELKYCGIDHVTIETEGAAEMCHNKECRLDPISLPHCHHG